MKLETLIEDFKQSHGRLSALSELSGEDVVRELRDEVYPSLVALAENLAELDGVVHEIVALEESYLDPELAQQILETIAFGAALVEAVKELELNDINKQKLLGLVAAFEESAEKSVSRVDQATVLEEIDDLPAPDAS